MKNTLKLKQKNAPSTTLEQDVLTIYRGLHGYLNRCKEGAVAKSVQIIYDEIRDALISANILAYELEEGKDESRRLIKVMDSDLERRKIAAQIMAGSVACTDSSDFTVEQHARYAVEAADALIEQLNKEM